MAWRRPGGKPLSEPMNDGMFYWRIYTSLSLNELNLVSKRGPSPFPCCQWVCFLILITLSVLNIFKHCHLGYLNLKINSPIKFYHSISMISRKLKSFNGNVGYKILRSHSPQEFSIALAIGLLLKSNTALCVLIWFLWDVISAQKANKCRAFLIYFWSVRKIYSSNFKSLSVKIYQC